MKTSKVVWHELGLDQPLVLQYAKWLLFLLRGDWGTSILTHQSVLTDIAYSLPVSIELIGLAMLISLLIALPAGVVAAVWPNSWKDYSAMVVAMAGVSTRNFFSASCAFFSLPWC